MQYLNVCSLLLLMKLLLDHLWDGEHGRKTDSQCTCTEYIVVLQLLLIPPQYWLHVKVWPCSDRDTFLSTRTLSITPLPYHVTTAGGLPDAWQLQLTSSPSMTKGGQLDSTGSPGYSERKNDSTSSCLAAWVKGAERRLPTLWGVCYFLSEM